MSTVTQKRGDVGTTITFALSDSRGRVDLTGANIRFLARSNPKSDVLKIDGAAVPDPDQVANIGQVSYTFTLDDLDTPGTFYVEWEATWGVSKRTFPNNGYDLLIVKEDL